MKRITLLSLFFIAATLFSCKPEADDSKSTVEKPEEPAKTEMKISAVTTEGNHKVTSTTVLATYGRGFLVGDNTGKILVFLNKVPSVAVGDVVDIEGAVTTYGGLLQFGSEAVVTKTGTATVDPGTPAELTGKDLDDYLNKVEIRYISYKGTLSIDGDYINVTVPDAVTAVGSIAYPVEGLVDPSFKDKDVKVTGYAIGIGGQKYVNTMATEVEILLALSTDNLKWDSSETDTKKVAVTTSDKAWKYDDSKVAEWFTVSKDADTLKVTPKGENKGKKAYSGDIVITANGISKNITVFQQVHGVVQVTYDFSKINDFSVWAENYGEHTITGYTDLPGTPDAIVFFGYANKQPETSPINNIPVIRQGGQGVVVTMRNPNSVILQADFKFRQWRSDKKEFTMFYSTDSGVNFTALEGTSTNFAISKVLPDNTNAVKVTTPTNKQWGAESVTLTYIKADSSD